MSQVETHIVPYQKTPVRLQDYGVGIFKAAMTKSALKKALKKGYVAVDDVTATTATFISEGEKITLTLPDKTAAAKKFTYACHVLFEDDHLAVIRKPAGIRVSGNHFKTVANALPQCIQASDLADAIRPQPVHRLDYATTGVLLIGKTYSSIRKLNALFQHRSVTKTYYAIAIGKMKGSGEIRSDVDGKESLSRYTRLRSVSSKRFGQLNLVRLYPETGRRHQLRIHLSAMGNPILGDPTYGTEGLILKGKGLYLHAHSLKFTHPFTEEYLCITDALPRKFEKIFPDIEE